MDAGPIQHFFGKRTIIDQVAGAVNDVAIFLLVPDSFQSVDIAVYVGDDQSFQG
jgi:hypothetical protein